MRAELARGRGGHERHQEDRRGRRAAELPADAGGGALRHQPQRRRGRLRGPRARAHVRRAARPAGEGAAHHRGRRPGPSPGRDADRRRHRGRAGRRARRRGRGRHGRDDDLHLRHDRQAEGRGPGRRPGSGSPRRPAEPVRLPARRHLHHLRPAVPQRPQRVHGRRPALRPDDHRAAQVRRRGLAAAGGQVPGELDVLRARAGPDDLRAAHGGQGPLRPLLHARHDGQRGAVELRAQAAVRGGLPARVAVRGLRVDRARRGHRADARGPDAQAGILRPAGARHRDHAGRRRRQRGHRHRAGPSRRGLRAVQGRVRHLLQERRQLRSRTAAATSIRSATSRTGTTRATCTSATARPT